MWLPRAYRILQPQEAASWGHDKVCWIRVQVSHHPEGHGMGNGYTDFLVINEWQMIDLSDLGPLGTHCECRWHAFIAKKD